MLSVEGEGRIHDLGGLWIGVCSAEEIEEVFGDAVLGLGC